MIIDTHCHLDMEVFDADREAVLQAARDTGITFFVCPSTTVSSWEKNRLLSEQHPDYYLTVGVHPHEAKLWNPEIAADLRRRATGPKVVAIGEIGLDYHYDYSPRDQQQKAFREQVLLARELHIPLLIHLREAAEDLLAILREEYRGEPFRGVVHCFSDTLATAQELLDLGFLLSFTGNITFKKQDALRDVVRSLQPEDVMAETDAPYMTPPPNRGKRNEPLGVLKVLDQFAECFHLSVADVARITSLNAIELFSLPVEIPLGAILYPIRNSLYINLTTRCSNECIFCDRNTHPVVKGHHIGLDREPTAAEVIAALEAEGGTYDEYVFCGYGEPTLRLAVLKEIAQYLKGRGLTVRLNTNGQGSLLNKRDILPELQGLVDMVSVSLDAPDNKTYQEVCLPALKERAYPAIKEFIVRAKGFLPDVKASVVALPGLDLEACRKVAEEELGVPLRVREYNVVG